MSDDPTTTEAPSPQPGTEDKPPPPGEAQRSGSAADALRSSGAFQSTAFSSQFQEVIPLSGYVEPFLAAQGLWQGLRTAVGNVLAGAIRSAEQVPVGVILADHALLGLAAASLHADVRVPVGPAERRYAAEDLIPSLSISTRLFQWLRGVEQFSATAQPLLMRAWAAAAEQLCADFVELADRPAGSHGAGVICLLQMPQTVAVPATLPVLLDVATRARDIVAETLLALQLPRSQAVDSRARALDLLDELTRQPGVTIDRILQALNTPEHDEFERLVWRSRLRSEPQTFDLFETYVLARDEDRPRHMASLFLVSHFAGLNASQFIDLGDFLAAETPAAAPGRDAARPPSKLTDRVLADCGIRFARTQGNAAVAMIGPRLEDLGPLPATSWAARAAEIVRQMFDGVGSLARERYLGALAMKATLGDPSDGIAKQYAELEIEALRSIASHDPAAAAERLCRIVFGLPAMPDGGNRATMAGERDFEAFGRAMRRAPALVRALADQMRGFPIAAAIDALCNAGPAVDDARWKRRFRHGAAALFWTLYAAEPTQVALAHFPNWTSRGIEARLRRREAVAVLQQIFRDPEADPLTREVGRNFADPVLLRRLIAQIALEFPRIVEDDDEYCAGALLTSTAVQYLGCTLPGISWETISPWNLNDAGTEDPQIGAQPLPPDLLLAKALLSTRVREWFAGRPARADESAASRDTALHDEGFLLWNLSRTTLEGLVGSAGFGDLETVTHDIWITVMMAAKIGRQDFSLQFNNTWLWKQLRNPDVDPEQSFLIDAFREIVQPLFDFFIVLVLIAATRAPPVDGRPGFIFSDQFKAWLTEGQSGTADPPAQRLATAIQTAMALQKNWRTTLSSLRLPPGSTGRVSQAYGDRGRMLEAFTAAVSPFIRASRSRPRTDPASGSSVPASSTSAADSQEAQS